MAIKIQEMHNYGLVGKNISYSFSKEYFKNKFKKLKLYNYKYSNFDLSTLEEFSKLLLQPIKGLNVTIPYKEEIIDFLDEIDNEAEKIGAVNTIKILENSRLKGFNTDAFGFEESIKPLLLKHHKNALVLGSGGASKAIVYVLNKLKINFKVVSRNPSHDQIGYNSIFENELETFTIIINCTPVGTSPDVNSCPKIPYQYLTKWHLLYDLIYNPQKSTFLKKGESKGATVINGLNMLKLQAEKSWEIWNK
jgi:shikimate dehydrogenase